jgi:hypothetical protein
MKLYKDLLLDDNGDLFAQTGQAIGVCNVQNIVQVLKMTHGNLFFAPMVGANMTKFMNTNNYAVLRNHIKKSLTAANITDVTDKDIELMINGNYND